jgi:hypothetical protein
VGVPRSCGVVGLAQPIGADRTASNGASGGVAQDRRPENQRAAPSLPTFTHPDSRATNFSKKIRVRSYRLPNRGREHDEEHDGENAQNEGPQRIQWWSIAKGRQWSRGPRQLCPKRGSHTVRVVRSARPRTRSRTGLDSHEGVTPLRR